MIRIFKVILILIFLSSCEEVIDWNYEGESIDGLAVESILSNDIKKQEIKITGLFNDLNGEAEGVSGAEVRVLTSTQVYHFSEKDMQRGVYQSDEVFAIQTNKNYFLQLSLGEHLYEAKSKAVASTWLRSFQLAQFGNTDSLYFPNLGVEYQVNEQAMYDFQIDWSHLQSTGKNQARLRHYAFNSLNIGQLFGPAKEQVYFPRGSRVIITKYALDDGFAEYLRTLVIEAQWKGGYFEESSGPITGNISNGAHGYFASCTVLADTLIAE